MFFRRWISNTSTCALRKHFFFLPHENINKVFCLSIVCFNMLLCSRCNWDYYLLPASGSTATYCIFTFVWKKTAFSITSHSAKYYQEYIDFLSIQKGKLVVNNWNEKWQNLVFIRSVKINDSNTLKKTNWVYTYDMS